MRKYLPRYLIFWLPALAVSLFYANETPLSHILRWFFAFFMLFGWVVNTGMAAYNHPRGALTALLAYSGFMTLITVVMYMTSFRDGLNIVMKAISGALLYRPLGIFLSSLSMLGNSPWELVLLCILTACCLAGYLAGLLHRRVHPNPYRPRMRRAK